jgi:hypothetical protein
MIRPAAKAALVALALSTTALSPLAQAKPAPAAASTAGVTVPPIVYKQRTLANGLKVYTSRDATTPNVTVQVWYGVGSKDDPEGRSGFAHLFEHLMFKSTRNMPNEFFDRLTEDVGGFNNASTYDDFTNYYEVVPANHLQRLLWAEAERLGSLVIDEAVFKSERDVVKEELRQRVLANPYGRFFASTSPRPRSRPPLQAPGHRLDRGAGRRHGRRRAGLPPGLLPPRQRRPDRGGQLRRSPAERLDRPVFRAAEGAGRADQAGHHRRARAHRLQGRHHLRPQRAAAGRGHDLAGPGRRRSGRPGPGGAGRHPVGRQVVAALQQPGL